MKPILKEHDADVAAMAKGLVEIENYLWYDGPLLSLFGTEDQSSLFIRHWLNCDKVNKVSRPVCFKITAQQQKDYEENKNTLLSIMKTCDTFYALRMSFLVLPLRLK